MFRCDVFVQHAHIRIGLLTLLTLPLLWNCGGGGGGGSPTTPPTPPLESTTASISASTTSIDENSNEPLTVTVTLNSTVDRTVQIGLNFAGTATRGIDYEADETQVSIAPNQATASVDLSMLRDWVADDDELIDVSMASFSEAVSAGSPASVSVSISDHNERPPAKNVRDRANLATFTQVQFDEDKFSLEVLVFNIGVGEASPTKVTVQSSTSFAALGNATAVAEEDVPSLVPNGSFRHTFEFDLASFEPNTTYYLRAHAIVVAEEQPYGTGYNTDYSGFTLDSEGKVTASCHQPNTGLPTGGVDPFFDQQWNIQNTGQSSYASSGGAVGADLGLTDVVQRGTPTGRGVKVAVVDTGLEICHPDLAQNVEQSKSFNFLARSGNNQRSWARASSVDPYLPTPVGGHGTSVAGVIGAVAQNGIGGRGVAPEVELRAYNYLAAQCCSERALGASNSDPDSSDVDIFNMSYGSVGVGQFDISLFAMQFYRNLTGSLRGGKGAIYVKAAGNSFNNCHAMRHTIHGEIGCDSNLDSLNKLPYLIAVGAFSANGRKSSYSSVGSYVWVAGPAGEYGRANPATLTTDQFGPARGYDSYSNVGLSINRQLNPDGAYVSTFNGTSAAAPNISGAIALLLERQPDLTWRDVKHVIAKTARVIDSDIPDVRLAIGDVPVTFQHGWTTNAAGFNFHNWYGFGAMDVDDALAYLEDYQPNQAGELIETEWFVDEGTVGIPDASGAGATKSMVVNVGNSVATVEAVLLRAESDHPFPAELVLELTSPSGTRSIVNPPFNNTIVGENSLDWIWLSNAFYGERPNGTWMLKAVDTLENDVGSLTQWSLQFFVGQNSN